MLPTLSKTRLAQIHSVRELRDWRMQTDSAKRASCSKQRASWSTVQLPDETICDCAMPLSDHGVRRRIAPSDKSRRCKVDNFLILRWVDFQKLTQAIPDPLIVRTGKMTTRTASREGILSNKVLCPVVAARLVHQGIQTRQFAGRSIEITAIWPISLARYIPS